MEVNLEDFDYFDDSESWREKPTSDAQFGLLRKFLPVDKIPKYRGHASDNIQLFQFIAACARQRYGTSTALTEPQIGEIFRKLLATLTPTEQLLSSQMRKRRDGKGMPHKRAELVPRVYAEFDLAFARQEQASMAEALWRQPLSLAVQIWSTVVVLAIIGGIIWLISLGR